MVACSAALSENPTNRIDSTYFQKGSLEADALLRSRNHATIADLSTSVLSFGAYALTNDVTYQDDGVPFLRCADLRGGFVSFGATLHIDDQANALLSKSKVDPYTVLLTMSGSVGEVAVALPTWNYPVNSNQDIAKIRVSGIDPYYLAVFLGSRLGQAQINRLPVGSVQQHIFLSMIERLIVPRFSPELEDAVSRTAQAAYKARDDATVTMADAEAALLDALGLRDWSPPKPLTYTRSASAAATAGRLDAEFAAPKVQALLSRLAASGSTIGDLSYVRREKFRAKPPGSFRYIEIGDLDGFGYANGSSVDLADAPSRATWFVRAGDVITSTVRPIRRLTAIVAQDQDGEVCSSGFVVLQPKTVSAELLMTYLRLPLVAELMHLYATASMYPALAENDLLALPMPAINNDVDDAVRDLVRKSRQQLKESEALLVAAKRAVEVAIEDGAASALSLLSEQKEGTRE